MPPDACSYSAWVVTFVRSAPTTSYITRKVFLAVRGVVMCGHKKNVQLCSSLWMRFRTS